MRRHAWPFLRKLCTITTVNGTSVYTISDGAGDLTYTCDRLINDVQWDATNQWRFVGAIGDDAWYGYQFGVVTEPIHRIWRLTSQTTLEMFPTPTADGDLLKVPFVTDRWAVNEAQDEYLAELAADTDTHLFAWDLFDAEAQWRFKELLGVDYAADRDRAERLLDERTGALEARGQKSLANQRGFRLLGPANVPETGYGS